MKISRILLSQITGHYALATLAHTWIFTVAKGFRKTLELWNWTGDCKFSFRCLQNRGTVKLGKQIRFIWVAHLVTLTTWGLRVLYLAPVMLCSHVHFPDPVQLKKSETGTPPGLCSLVETSSRSTWWRQRLSYKKVKDFDKSLRQFHSCTVTFVAPQHLVLCGSFHPKDLSCAELERGRRHQCDTNVTGPSVNV